MAAMDQNPMRENGGVDEDVYYRGVGIHSQVTKVKEEMEKINRLALQQPEEARPALRRVSRQHHRSRSPLGLAQRPISVGN